jgi:uncharacterized Zn finger protein
MAQIGKTWWGQRFIAALEGCMDAGRLQRGRSYSGDHRILSFEMDQALVSARVRGNVNPYFGVYKEPKYQVRLRLTPIPDQDWNNAIVTLGSNAALISQLLMGEMPERIDEVFAGLRLHLLPQSRKDFALTECSCPDYANPCKHIAGVYYRLAGMLDSDPFLLFELRGLSRERLHQSLRHTPLGQALVSMMDTQTSALEPAESFFTRPQPAAVVPGYRAFWNGAKRLPTEIEPATPPVVSGILVRKAGDFPGFWERNNSFVEVMEDLYERVRGKSKGFL